MNPIPLSWTLIGAAVAAVIAFGSGWKVRGWEADAARTRQVEQDARDAARRADHVDTVDTVYETKEAAAQVRERVIAKEVAHAVAAKPDFYGPGAPLAVDADGLRLVSEALAAADPASGPAPAVPASDGAR